MQRHHKEGSYMGGAVDPIMDVGGGGGVAVRAEDMSQSLSGV